MFDTHGPESAPDEPNTFVDLAVAPIRAQFALIHAAGDKRALLDALRPHAFVARVREGKQAAVTQCAHLLGPTSLRTLADWAERAAARAFKLQDQWVVLDEYQRNGVWHGLKAGLVSEEAALGAAAGAMLGPVGAAIGGAIGGWWAGSQKDEEFQRGLQALAESIASWWEAVASDFDDFVLPAIAEDAAKAERALPAYTVQGHAKSRLPIAVLTALAIGGVAFGIWATWVREPPAEPHVEPAIAVAPPAVEPPSLAGEWSDASGASYCITKSGPDYDVISGSCSTTGRVALFTLSPRSTSPGELLVRQRLHPATPTGLVLDARAADTCHVIVKSHDAKPLMARLSGGALRIDATRLDVPKKAFKTQRGVIVGCNRLDDYPRSLGELVLARE